MSLLSRLSTLAFRLPTAGTPQLRFARAPDTLWPGNFRDFGAAILKLCDMVPRGRVTLTQVNEETTMLHKD